MNVESNLEPRLRHHAAVQPCSKGLYSVSSISQSPTLLLPWPLALFPCSQLTGWNQWLSSGPDQKHASWLGFHPLHHSALSVCLLKSLTSVHSSPVPSHLLVPVPLISHLDYSIAIAAFTPAPLQSILHRNQQIHSH